MWVDPLVAFGDMSIPILISNAATLIGFFLASFFALKYTHKFYEGRPTPKSWFMIILGLSVLVVSEALQFIITYIEEVATLLQFYNIVAISIQDIGIVVVLLGTFFLFKEVI